MFRCTRFNETRRFRTYAEAYRFVMREGDQNRLWHIRAASVEVMAACRAEKMAFHSAHISPRI